MNDGTSKTEVVITTLILVWVITWAVYGFLFDVVETKDYKISNHCYHFNSILICKAKE